MMFKNLFYTLFLLLIPIFVFSANLTENQRINSSQSNDVVIGDPSANTTVDFNPKTGSFNDVNVRNLYSFGIDYHYPEFVDSNMVVKVKTEIKRWDENNTALTTENRYFEIEYNSDFGQTVNDLQTIVLKDGYKTEVTIDSIYVNGSSVDTLPVNMYFDVTIDVERYYDFSSYTSSVISINDSLIDYNCDTINDALLLSWTDMLQAEGYQLEWTFVDDYGLSSGAYLTTSDIDFNFIENSTRVEIVDNEYKINLVYPHGYLIYRIRPIGVDFNNPVKRIYGAWSEIDKGNMNANGVTDFYHITEPFNNKHNWQYNATYAEEGKRKEVVSFYDGSLRNRQNVTQINSNDLTVVEEKIYDHQGRVGINVLPSPVYGDSCNNDIILPLNFIPNFTLDDSLNAYSKNDFDLDVSNCASLAAPMSETSGAANYYSDSNQYKQGHQKFVPDANQYPFVQTEYTPDNTGRVRKKGGVGEEFQLGSNQETTYLYGTPNQIELDRLFGSEVGNASHYKKKAVIDPNGQASISYYDMKENVIATSLSGSVPVKDNDTLLHPLESFSDAEENITVDLFAKDANGNSQANKVILEDNEIRFTNDLLVIDAGSYAFSYDLEIPRFEDSCLYDGICFHCVYELKIEVLDECGENFALINGNPIDSLVGNFTVDSSGINYSIDCSDGSYSRADSFTTFLEQGKYTVVKTLTVSEQARDYYLSQYLSDTINACYVTEDDFIQDQIDGLDTSGCYIDCSSCVASLGTRDDFIANGGTALEFDYLVERCNAPCKKQNQCDVLYQQMCIDVSPHGQYGFVYDTLSPPANVSIDDFFMSVFYGSNKLPKNNFIDSAYWKNPWRNINGTWYPYYMDEMGNKARVYLNNDINGGFIPEIDSDTIGVDIFWDSNLQQYYTDPQNIKYVNDFISYWNPESWAKSLVVYHPEYCYYEICSGYEEVKQGHTTSSNDFDNLLNGTSSFDEAIAAGLIKSNYSTYSDPNERLDIHSYTAQPDGSYDPWYNETFYNTNSFATNFYNYHITQNGDTLSLLEMAAFSARCQNGLTGGNTISSCTNFGSDYTGDPVIDDSIRNLEWQFFKDFYVSLKQQNQLYYAHKIAKDECGCFNACIGDDDFSHINLLEEDVLEPNINYILNHSSSVFLGNASEECFTCSEQNYHFYKDKIKRYGYVENVTNDLDVNDNAYQIYLQTGQCPVTFNLNNLLNSMIAQDSLLADTVSLDHDDYYYAVQLALHNYNELAVDTFSHSWVVSDTTLDQIEIEIYDHLNDTTSCFLTFDKSVQSADDINYWSDIESFQLMTSDGYSNGSYDFIIQVTLANDSIDTLQGTTCFNIQDCIFEKECELNELAWNTIDFWSNLAGLGILDTTSLNLTAIGLEQYAPVQVSNILGQPDSLAYTSDFNNTITFYDDDNPSNQVKFEIFTIDPSGFNDFDEVAYITGAQGSGANAMEFDLIDSSNQVIASLNVRGYHITATDTSALQLAECDFPTPNSCEGSEFEIADEFLNVLQERLIDGYNGGNIDLIASPNITSGLIAQWGYLDSTSSYFDTAIVDTNYIDSLVFDVGCTGNNYLSILKNDTETHTFTDLISVDEIILTGNTDLNQDYHSFFLIATFNEGAGNFVDTIFGETCIGMKQCITCPDTLTTIYTDTTQYPQSFWIQQDSLNVLEGNVYVDNSAGVYGKYLNIVDTFNASQGWTTSNDEYVYAVEYREFFREKYAFSLQEYERFLNSYWDVIDNLSHTRIENFNSDYGGFSNVNFDHSRVISAISEYNKMVSRQRLRAVDHVSDSLFRVRSLSDSSDVYIEHIKTHYNNISQAESITDFYNDNNMYYSADTCWSLYLDYLDAYDNYKSFNDTTHKTLAFDKLNEVLSYGTFIDLEMCKDTVGFNLINELTDLYADTSNTPTRFVNLRNFGDSIDTHNIDTVQVTTTMLTVDCGQLYEYYFDALNEYNGSDFAMANNDTLFPEFPGFLGFQEFQDAGFCEGDCAMEYYAYLDEYVAYDSATVAPLPLTLLEYCNGDTLLDECEILYAEYVEQITLFNDFVQNDTVYNLSPIGGVISLETFINEQYCNCYPGYKALLNDIMSYAYEEAEVPFLYAALTRYCYGEYDVNCSPSAPNPGNIQFPEVDPGPDPCVEQMLSIAEINGSNYYENHINALTSHFIDAYNSHCLGALENFDVNYDFREHHYTLYYYDQAGNLIKTIPPEGVKPLDITSHTDSLEEEIIEDRTHKTHTVFTNHNLETRYEYNSLNQLVKQVMPDHETVDIWETKLPSGLRADLIVTDLQFINQNKGFLSGYVPSSPLQSGLLYKTDDGGSTWQRVNHVVADEILSMDHRVAVGKNGLIMNALGNPYSWNSSSLYAYGINEDLYDFAFGSTPGEVVIVGDSSTIIQTSGGGSFNIINTSSMGFENDDKIVKVIHDGYRYFAIVNRKNNNGLLQGLVFASNSDGTIWKEVHGINTSLNFNTISALGNDTLLAAGEDGKLFISTDEGDHWMAKKTGKINEIYSAINIEQNKIVALMDSSNHLSPVYYSINNGENWSKVSDPGRYYHDIKIISDSAALPYMILAGGEDGVISKYLFSNSGSYGHEEYNEVPNQTNIFAIDGVIHQDTTYIIAAGEEGKVYFSKRRNNWQSQWSEIGSGVTSQYDSLLDVTFKKVNLANDPVFQGVIHAHSGELYTIHMGVSDSEPTIHAVSSPTNKVFTALGESSYRNIFYAYDNDDQQMYYAEADSTSSITNFTLMNASQSGSNELNSLVVTDSTIALAGKGGALVKVRINSAGTAFSGGWVNRRDSLIPLPLNDLQKNTATNLVFAMGDDGYSVGYVASFATPTSTTIFPTYLSKDINAFKFSNNNDLIAVGDSGYIMKASQQINGGLPVAYTSVTNNDLTDLILDGNKIYVSGENGTILYGSDFNTDNILLTQQNTDVNFNTLHSTYSGVFVGGEQATVRSLYGGTYMSINDVFPLALKSVSFSDPAHGYVVGDNYTVRYTNDGGQTWSTILPTNGFPSGVPNINSVAAISHNSGYIVGDDEYEAEITTNTADEVAWNSGSGKDFNAVEFASGTDGLIVGADGGNGLYKHYSGSSWGTLQTEMGVNYNAIHKFDHNGTYMIAGTNAQIHYYNGSALNPTDYNPLSIGSTNLTDITFVDRKNGYAVGDNGVLIKTEAPEINQSTGLLYPLSWARKPLNDSLNNQFDTTSMNLNVVGSPHFSKVFWAGSYTGDTLVARYAKDEEGRYSTYFWYDKLGRIVVSQNSRQRKADPINYSYTLYDELGRVYETGVKQENDLSSSNTFETIFGSSVSGYFNPDVIEDTLLNSWIAESTGERVEVAKTYYDTIIPDVILPNTFSQENLRNRVAAVTYEEEYDGIDTTYDHATHYSYDIHGNVNTLLQDNKLLSLTEERYKRFDYEYDLISGNVNQVIYQPKRPDAFYHKYNYDADNRLTRVETSRDNVNWDLDAKYFYYDHGPLARVEIGDNQVQGLDYVYTLQGWLKTVNSDNLMASADVGLDGHQDSTNLNQLFARDVMGYSLGYYNGDYAAIDKQMWNDTLSRPISIIDSSDVYEARENLYNGNIGHMVTALRQPLTRKAMPQATAYQYDQLNRLIEMQAYSSFSSVQNQWINTSGTYDGRYNNKFTYDANGNILKQVRNDMAGDTIENMQYHYARNTGGELIQNRLYHINDTIVDSLYVDDIDDMGTFEDALAQINSDNNYSYDAIGQLIKDKQEGIERIEWTQTGKVKAVYRDSTSKRDDLIFDYDAMGNRIAKHVYDTSGVWKKSLYYSRDAQGNTMGVYIHENIDSTMMQSYRVTERSIYGSDRLGLDRHEIELIAADSIAVDTFGIRTAGNKHYELKNHLGNVLAVISDRKLKISDSTYWPSFDGIQSYASTTSINEYGFTDEITIEAWVKTTDNSAVAPIFGSFQPSSDKGIMIYLTNGYPKIIGKNGNTTSSSATGSYTINDDEWHHVVGTINGDHWKLFVDGDFVAEKTPTFGTYDYSCNCNYRVARAFHAPYYLEGEVREVSLWKRAKSHNEIASSVLKEYDISDSTLVSYWKLDDNDPTSLNEVSGSPSFQIFNSPSWVANGDVKLEADILNITDYTPFGVQMKERSYDIGDLLHGIVEPDFKWDFNDGDTTEVNGSGHDATLYNGVALVDDKCNIESAYEADGVNDYIRIDDHSDFDPGAEDFTVSIWVKKLSATVNSEGNQLVNKWELAVGNLKQEWALTMSSGTSGANGGYIKIGSGANTYTAWAGSPVNLNEWYHIVGMRDGDSIRYYMNGKEEAVAYCGNVTVNNGGSHITIGAMPAPSWYHSNAIIDDFAYYQKALTKEEVAQLYNAGCDFYTPQLAYRYGFQGQEKDDEIKGEGNSINYKHRMHDPRVGRFFAIDPMVDKYPHFSPYQFSGNTPIVSIELEGLESSVTLNYNEATVTIKRESWEGGSRWVITPAQLEKLQSENAISPRKGSSGVTDLQAGGSMAVDLVGGGPAAHQSWEVSINQNAATRYYVLETVVPTVQRTPPPPDIPGRQLKAGTGGWFVNPGKEGRVPISTVNNSRIISEITKTAELLPVTRKAAHPDVNFQSETPISMTVTVGSIPDTKRQEIEKGLSSSMGIDVSVEIDNSKDPSYYRITGTYQEQGTPAANDRPNYTVLPSIQREIIREVLPPYQENYDNKKTEE